MIEDEILSILLKTKEECGTLEATAIALGGISPSTLHCWIKARKGIKDQPLFKVLDFLGYHLTNSIEKATVSPFIPADTHQGKPEKTGKTEGNEKISTRLARVQAESLETLKVEVLKAKNEGLEKQMNFLLAHNETLQRQLDTVNSLLSKTINKKEDYNSSATNGITNVN